MSLLLTLKVLNPSSESRPHGFRYLAACIRILRPDLGDEARFLMAGSIQSQILFFHRDMPMIALLRGTAYGPQDLGILASHIFEFSIRGLSLGVEPQST